MKAFHLTLWAFVLVWEFMEAISVENVNKDSKQERNLSSLLTISSSSRNTKSDISIEDCSDSEEHFSVTKPNGQTVENVDCQFIAGNLMKRSCTWTNAKEMCPRTCKQCTCEAAEFLGKSYYISYPPYCLQFDFFDDAHISYTHIEQGEKQNKQQKETE